MAEQRTIGCINLCDRRGSTAKVRGSRLRPFDFPLKQTFRFTESGREMLTDVTEPKALGQINLRLAYLERLYR